MKHVKSTYIHRLLLVFSQKLSTTPKNEQLFLWVFVEDKLGFFLLGLVHRHTGEHRLGQLCVISPFNDETNLHEHLPAARRDVVNRLLGQGGELVHVDIHFHVLHPVIYAAEDRTRTSK